MGWSLSDTGYRVQGYFDREQNALFFDLKTATILDTNKKEDEMN
jgi:hypothetical protein